MLFSPKGILEPLSKWLTPKNKNTVAVKGEWADGYSAD
jgi:hypothetical protein